MTPEELIESDQRLRDIANNTDLPEATRFLAERLLHESHRTNAVQLSAVIAQSMPR